MSIDKTSCVLCFQQVASLTSGVFIGTHTPDLERVRTDDLAETASLEGPLSVHLRISPDGHLRVTRDIR